MDLHQKAEVLLKLHHQPQPVIFVNAWDAATARIVADLGFPAIATSSAAIAFAEGFPDGQAIRAIACSRTSRRLPAASISR